MSYAIVKSGGMQHRVEAERKLRVPRLTAEEGQEISLDEVLFYADGDDVRVGAPTVDGVTVKARVVAHGRSRKITVFKFKRRKNYKRTKGHRQRYTLLEVLAIDA